MRPLIEHQDAVAGQHRRKPVRDDQRGAVLHQPGERGLHQRLAFGIERGGGLVEQQQRRAAQDRARDGDALALAAGQRHAALADRRVVALRQQADEARGGRVLGGALDLRVGGVGPAEADVVAHAHGEDRGVLRHQRDVTAKLGRIGIGQPHAVERHGARLRIVEPQDQVEDRALARAGGADDRDLLARLDVERHAVEHVGLRPRRIGEADTARRRPRRAGAAAAARDAPARAFPAAIGEQLGEPLGRARGLRQLAPDLAQLAEPACRKHREQHELAERSRRHVVRRSRPARRPRG